MPFDIQLLKFINQFAGQWLWLDAAAIFFADYSGYIFIGILLGMSVLKWKNYALTVSGALTSGICAYIVTEIVRFFYNRPRPFETIDVIQLIEHETGSSLPSAHATFFFSISVFLFLHSKRLGTLFILWAFLISFFRVFSGIHYPLDVAGGFAVGAITAVLLYKFAMRIHKKLRGERYMRCK